MTSTASPQRSPAETSPGQARTPWARLGVPAWLDRAAAWSWRLAVVAVALTIAWFALRAALLVVIPVVLSLILVAALAPVIDVLARRLPRLLATWIVVTAVIGALVGVVLIVVPPLIDSVADLGDDVDEIVEDVKTWLTDGPLALDPGTVDDLETDLRDRGDELVDGIAADPLSEAQRIARIAGAALLTLVLTFFLLADGPALWRWILRRVRPDRRPLVDAGGRSSMQTLRGWVLGSVINGVLEAASIAVVLVLVGAPAIVPLTVLTFFAPFFPVVGATVTGALAVALTFAANGPTAAIIVAVAALAIQQLEGNVLVPVIMRRAVSLHPVVTLLVLTLGGAVAGILGALLAVPLTAAVVAAVRSVRSEAQRLGPPPTDRLIVD